MFTVKMVSGLKYDLRDFTVIQNKLKSNNYWAFYYVFVEHMVSK